MRERLHKLLAARTNVYLFLSLPETQLRPPPQAAAVFRRRIRATQPSPAKPVSAIAQVEGSGTAGVVPSTSAMVIAPSPAFTPETSLSFAKRSPADRYEPPPPPA
jgi:hypothetical protein